RGRVTRRPLRGRLLAGVERTAGLGFLTLALSRRWHYAWVVMAGAMVILAVSAGVRWSFGILVYPLHEQFGWSVGAISFAYFLMFISAVPLVLMAGWLTDNFGLRLVMPVGVVLLTLGMLLTASVTQLWQFYLFYGVLVGGINMTFTALLSATVTRWFHRRVGLAVGLVFASTGLGPLVLAPLFGWLIPSVGWRPTFLLIGIPGGLLMLVAALLLRSHPGALVTVAYGGYTGYWRHWSRRSAAPSVTLRMVQGDRTFWFLIAIHFLGCVGHSVLIAHLVPLALLKGVPGLVAAGLISAVSGASIASRFGIPILTERWGGRATLTLAFLVQSVAILMYLGAESVFLLYLVSILFGLGLGGEMSGFPIMNRRYYGTAAPLNSIHAWEWSGGLVGMALGGWLGGVLFDLSGSYTWSIWMAALGGLAALPFILSLPRWGAQQPIVTPTEKAEPVPSS
ncbi:MAG: MFS transporter, partial [Dehalococcoidia bacterium]